MIEKKKDLHGVYIRVSEDSGNAVGSHVEWLERVVDTETGQVYAATLLPPEPLEPSREALSPLMGEAFVAVQMELDRERIAHAETRAELEALAERYAALEGQLRPEPEPTG